MLKHQQSKALFRFDPMFHFPSIELCFINANSCVMSSLVFKADDSSWNTFHHKKSLLLFPAGLDPFQNIRSHVSDVSSWDTCPQPTQTFYSNKKTNLWLQQFIFIYYNTDAEFKVYFFKQPSILQEIHNYLELLNMSLKQDISGNESLGSTVPSLSTNMQQETEWNRELGGAGESRGIGERPINKNKNDV